MTTRRLLVLFESVRATRATTPRFRSSCRAQLESGHARTRAVSNNARRQRSIDRSMDDASFRHKTTTTKERRKDTGRTSVSSWTACPGAYPAYPAMSESPEKVRTSSRARRSRASESDRRRGVPPFLHQRRRLFCVWLNFGWWGGGGAFLPSFLSFSYDIFQNARRKTNKQTNKLQTNEERNKHTKVLKIRTKYSRVAYVLVCVTNNI